MPDLIEQLPQATWVVAGALGILLLVGWWRPTALLLCVIATFAVGPQWVLPGLVPATWLAWAAPLQHGLLVLALLANALRFGVRLTVRPWPTLAALVLLGEVWLISDPSFGLNPSSMALAAIGLALPWMFVNVVLDPAGRRPMALTIVLLPVIGVVIGAVLQALGLYALFVGDTVQSFRLQGATNAGWLGMAAFVGFAVGLHEAVRTGRRHFAYLASLDLAVAIASGGRMAIFACLIFAVTYVLLSERVRERLGSLGRSLILGGSLVAAVLIFALPFLYGRMIGLQDVALDLSGREAIWAELVQEFQVSPWFGRGLGASELGVGYFQLPHNEYLRLLVDCGVVGLAVFALAVVLWGREVVRAARPNERGFLHGMFVALAVFALTDNVLIMSPTLMAFVHLAAALGQQRERQRLRREDRPAERGHGREYAWQMPGSAATALREPPVAAARTPRASGPGPIAATFQRIGVVPRPPPSPADDGARAELLATPGTPEAIAEELRRLIAAGELDEVRAALAAVPAAHAEDVEIVSLRAALEVAETATHLPELGALATRFAADDGDHAARLDLAVALFQDRQVAEAVDLLVEGVRKDRDWRDQAMRRQLVTFFAALGHKHPATVEGRRKLAAVLFA